MKTELSQANPFGPSRYGYLFEVLSHQEPGRHLDYGCFDGRILSTLSDVEVVSSGVGVDLNADAVATIEPGSPGLEFAVLEPLNPDLSSVVPNGTIDSASLLDVLEHVADQQRLLRSLRAALRPGGRLVVTVPQRHFFSVLDGGNFKFRAPRIHRWLYLRRHSAEEYHSRYVDNPHGLVGDIEKEKSWHQHFSAEELVELVERCGFEVRDVDGAGLFHRPLVYLQRCRLPLGRVIERDMSRWAKCHLFLTAVAV